MPASAGSASSSPASGIFAPGVNTGAAPSPSSPNRASARSPCRGTGSGSTGSASVSPGSMSCAHAPLAPASPLPSGCPAAWRMPTRPSAERTANSDTPHWRAISACVSPPAASSRIRAVTCGVSFDGPFGPRLPGSSPASPCPAYALRHRQNVAASVPNAAAMSFLSAPVSSAS